jgi:hypothetical protein
MSQSVCLYSELEPYSGSIRHDPSDLPRLIGDLKFSCLFYDVVVLHRRNLWEHPLTLPAFERLAPFVQSGQLWTSANESDGLPVDYVEEKVQKLEAFFGKGYLKKINAENDIKERWLRITPPGDWMNPRRCVSEQAACVLKNIADYLSKFEDKKFRQLHPLLNLVERMRADKDFDKEKTLAKVGTLRGLLDPADLSEIATLIQTEFVRAGANFNDNAVIYPGQSVQCLTNPHFEPLPFDHQRLHHLKERMNSVGFNLDELINLPVPILFNIAQSPQWLRIRNALLNDSFDADIQEEMRSVFSTHLSFQNKMEKLLNISCHFQEVDNSQPDLSPLFMPSPWGLVSQSLLGSAPVAASFNLNKASKLLDLGSRVLYDDNSQNYQVKFSAQETHFLSLIVNAGKSGLTVEHLTQWLIELDALKMKVREWEAHIKLNSQESDEKFFQLRNKLEWVSQAKPYPEWDETPSELRNRIDGLNRDVNKKLKPLGLRIAAEKGKGKWYLASDSAVQDCVVNLSSTVWEEGVEQKERPEPPKGLSKQSKTIWECLSKEAPKFVHVIRLAEVLEKEWHEKTQKQISDAIYKLKQRLKNDPWMIKASSMGEYALVRR